jgi:hypothetical protein
MCQAIDVKTADAGGKIQSKSVTKACKECQNKVKLEPVKITVALLNTA